MNNVKQNHKETLSSKTWQEKKTVIFLKLQEINTLYQLIIYFISNYDRFMHRTDLLTLWKYPDKLNIIRC